MPEQDYSRLWFSPGLRSYHLDRSKHFNENNLGLGLEYDLAPGRKLIAGEFRNSVDRPSRYFGSAFTGQPINWLPDMRIGALLGGISGYPQMRGGGFFPMVAPVMTWERGPIGLDVIAMPRVGNISPVLAAMLKARF
jgi:hypothetical protein